ncbi:MAG TPA: aromatic amino acid ammonia-lyase [Myxococcota bacterium]|nr:aromatic amino acid ammonia-lyase [Myxococcota bacterium]
MTIVLDGQSLTIEKLTAVARDRQPLEVAEQCWEKISNCRTMLQKKIDAHEIMYGVNTGIGEFSEVVLNDDQVQKYQRFLVYSHAAGIGKPMPEEVVRGAMTSRINVHCHGHSGQRPIVTKTFVEMLNKGVTPVVCEKGSVGACGDLAPMAQLALVLIGEGQAFYKGRRLSGLEAMQQAGIQPITFEARDGLASINGSNMLTAMAALVIYDVERFLKISEIAAATTLECLKANMKPYDSRLHTERGFLGAVASARNILKLTEGSQILAQKGKKVQDAYSMRSTPQVTGAARDAVAYARSQIEIELNGVGDNPIFLWEDDAVLTGANFQGTPVSLPTEMVGTAVSMLSVLSERRLNRLMNPALSAGLPPFLTEGAGMHSGLMLSQYTAGMLCVESRILSQPAANQSIPAAADQEDFVSMGMNTSLKTRQIHENGLGVLAIELIAGAQALDLRAPLKPGRGVAAAHAVVRRHVEHLGDDRPLFDDHNAMVEVLRSGELLSEVEEAAGPLE